MYSCPQPVSVASHSVETPMKDPLRGGHKRKNLSTKELKRHSTKDTRQNSNQLFIYYSYREHLYKRQTAPICPLFRGSTV